MIYTAILKYTFGVGLLLNLHHVSHVHGEVFTSISQLRELVKAERKLMKSLDLFIHEEEKKLEQLKSIKDAIEEDIPKVQDAHDFIGHPINAFHLIKRVSGAWASVFHHSGNFAPYNEFKMVADEVLKIFPQHQDYHGACHAILRIQNIYKLNTTDIANGIIMKNKAMEPLSAVECLDIATTSTRTQYYRQGLEWIHIAMQRNLTVPDILDAKLTIADIYRLDGNHTDALQIIHDIRADDQYKDILTDDQKSRIKLTEAASELTVAPGEAFALDWLEDYGKLCRGETLKTPKEVSQLKCRYKVGFNPYAPTKEEVLSISPWISMFYDVITNEESEFIKHEALPELARAHVGDPSKADVTDQRVGKVAWIYDTHHPRIHQLSHRVAEITGLHTEYKTSLSHSEPFQDISMLDHVPDFIKNTGDRISTFLFYLNDVEAGGATVFPYAKVHVPAVKGAAAFWFNVKRSGENDVRTLHAGCPVVLGQKWVANKWIRERGQYDVRPCGLTPDTGEDLIL